MQRRPTRPSKYVLSVSIETEDRHAKQDIKSFVVTGLTTESGTLGITVKKVRVRSVDLD